LLASTNSVALDVSMAQIIGYDPLDIPILANALQRGIQLKDIGDIILEGGVLKDFRVKNFKRIAIERKYNFVYMGVRFEQLRRRFDRRPVFDHDRCILCQKCVQMCKAEALKVRDGKITIHDPNCIRCYCCHEVCPVSAIDIKRKVFG
jgi:ferredoxin